MGQEWAGVWEREPVSSHRCAKAAGVVVGPRLEHFHGIQESGPPGSAWWESRGSGAVAVVSTSGSTPGQLRQGQRRWV